MKEISIDRYCRNLRFLRRKFHLSVLEMALMLGISTDAVLQIEAGKLPEGSTVEEIIRLAEALHYSYNNLFMEDPEAQERAKQ